MKTYNVFLSKTYSLKIDAESPKEAKELAEFFTGDVSDISSETDKNLYKFSIDEIECLTNEAFDCNELEKINI